MIKELVKVANKLDSLGLQKEADIIDAFITKEATAIVGGEKWLQDFVDYLEEHHNFTFDGDIIIMDGGETFPTPSSRWEAAERLSQLGLEWEEISDILGEVELKPWEEPPVNIEDVKRAFIEQFKDSRELDTLEINSIRWETEPSEYPHYKVRAMGTYRPYKYKADDYFHDEPVGKGTKVKEYPMNIDFWLEPDGEYPRGTPITGTDGKTYYFYGKD